MLSSQLYLTPATQHRNRSSLRFGNVDECSIIQSTMFVRTLIFILVVSLALTSGCEITVKNVGLKTFTWRISYAGVEGHSKDLEPGESENHACTCLPHDMYVDYGDIYCYHYMNCINKNQYQVEVGEYAIYINVGNKNVETCVL